MIRQVIYRYLGTNGIIDSPIHLEDIYYIRRLKLLADAGKILTDGTRRVKQVIINEEDLDKWTEVDV